MRSTAMITAAFTICVVCIFTDPACAFSRTLDKNILYSPEQVEYIKLSTAMCPDNTILWPANRRCYREGEQGPCNIGRVLTLHHQYLKPYCKDTVKQ